MRIILFWLETKKTPHTDIFCNQTKINTETKTAIPKYSLDYNEFIEFFLIFKLNIEMITTIFFSSLDCYNLQ